MENGKHVLYAMVCLPSEQPLALLRNYTWLVDTMLFRPSFIEPNDVKNLASSALSQMVADGVTVPHLLGAATHVSSIGEYVTVFKRAFAALGITEIIESKLRQTETNVYLPLEGTPGNLYAVLANLFEARNHLVHEIDLSAVGHYTLRDTWDPEMAAAFGQAVVSAIKLVEANLTEHAPEDFPNRLEADGIPEDELEKLKKAVISIQDELSALFMAEDFGSAWKEALEASKASQELELNFIDEASFLRPVRHFDMRRSVQVEYLKAKLSYLLLVKSEADQYPWAQEIS